VIICVCAVGQTASLQTRTITGTVVDAAGTALPGVTIELRQGTLVERRTTSNGAGVWQFDNVAPGRYALRLTLAGFRTTEMPLAVGDAPPAPLRVTLQIGALSETMTVTQAEAADAAQRARGVGSALGPGVGGGAYGGVIRQAEGGIVGGVAGGVVGGVPAPPPPAGAPPAPARAGHVVVWPAERWLPRDTASYASIQENVFLRTSEHALSTFSIDVDTASYANVRRFLNVGALPPSDAVRIEEMINYFRFDYPAPRGGAPVSITTEVGAAPWNPTHKLALVGLRSTVLKLEKTPPRNLTFLLDVSGSMAPLERLPLVKTAMRMLVESLRPEDTVAIVVYAGASGVALMPTSGARKEVITQALEELRSGGSTNGAAGIRVAYDLASQHFVKGGINRVILATDGDFNVGTTSPSELMTLIEDKRASGIFLSVLGVGDDNLKDSTMEMLADKGNGNYSYLDSIQEARRVLIAEAGSTLVTVAKDVKIQIEFNPRFVGGYRLIGYENRTLQKEDFNNDRKDAGEMGAGHTVTALYELVPAGEPVPGADVDPLKYQRQPDQPVVASPSNELMTIKVRYKAPDGDTSRLLEFPVRDTAPRMSANLGFAAAVAEFGMLLRRSEFKGNASWSHAQALAREHRGRDEDGCKAEFIRLVELAGALDTRSTTSQRDVGR
jgi:Ca-activated chloride channel family protein